MQNVGHRGGSPLPGSSRGNLASSRSNLASSRSSTDGIHVLSQENGDELESYLSILAGEGKKKQKQRAVVDWGKLLDGHEEEYHNNQGEGELDVHRSVEPDAAAPILFLKPQAKQSKPQAEPGQSTGIDSTRRFPIQPNSLKDLSSKKIGLNVSLVGSHMDIDLADSVSLTDTTTTTEESRSENTTDLLANTPPPSCNKRTDRIESTLPGGPDEQSETVHVYVDTKMDNRRLSASQAPVMNEKDTVSIEGDSSDLSLSQNLFRNNLFTLDQLVAGSAISTADENTLDSSKEINVELARPYEVQSLADLESLPEESKIELQSTVKEHQMSAPGVHQTKADDRAAEESYSLNGRHLDHHTSVVDGKDSSSVSYEEDFESDTVESNGSTHGLGDAATYLQAPAGKRTEESTLDNESDSSEWEQAHANSTYSSPQSHPKHHNTTTDTTICATTDSDSRTHTCESGTMTEESYLQGKCMCTHVCIHAMHGHNGYIAGIHREPTSASSTQPPLSTLCEYPPLHPSPLLPHILTPSHVTG